MAMILFAIIFVITLVQLRLLRTKEAAAAQEEGTMTYSRGMSSIGWPILKYLLLILISLCDAAALLLEFSASLMTTKEIIQTPRRSGRPGPGGQLPKMAEVVNIGHADLNSIVVAVAVVIGLLFTSSLTGFAFAKYNFPLKTCSSR